MNDETGVQIVGARSKRTYQQMSNDSNEGSSRSWSNNFHSGGEIANSRPSRLPHIRTSRDGYDLRSPAHRPAQQEAVIDLTEETEASPQRALPRDAESGNSNSGRLPRFGRNILGNDILENIVDLEDGEDEIAGIPTQDLSSSPEVQFVGSTTRRQPLPSRALNLPSIHRPSSTLPNPRRQTNESSMFSFLSSVPGLLRNIPRRYPPPEIDSFLLGSNLGIAESFNDLSQLNYEFPSFSMGSSSQQGPPSRRNEYKPPSPAPEGFTRTLGEEDVAVCPNCYWELGTGEGKKQEIWVAKPCGHVYCGECSDNRSLSRAKKAQGPLKTKPFSKCQVLDCGKSVSAPTSMIHIYL